MGSSKKSKKIYLKGKGNPAEERVAVAEFLMHIHRREREKKRLLIKLLVASSQKLEIVKLRQKKRKKQYVTGLT